MSDQRPAADRHARGEEPKRARALNERPRKDVVERHAQGCRRHDEITAPRAWRRLLQSRGQGDGDAQHGHRDTGRLAPVSGSIPRTPPTTMVISGSVDNASVPRATVVKPSATL